MDTQHFNRLEFLQHLEKQDPGLQMQPFAQFAAWSRTNATVRCVKSWLCCPATFLFQPSSRRLRPALGWSLALELVVHHNSWSQPAHMPTHHAGSRDFQWFPCHQNPPKPTKISSSPGWRSRSLPGCWQSQGIIVFATQAPDWSGKLGAKDFPANCCGKGDLNNIRLLNRHGIVKACFACATFMILHAPSKSCTNMPETRGEVHLLLPCDIYVSGRASWHWHLTLPYVAANHRRPPPCHPGFGPSVGFCWPRGRRPRGRWKTAWPQWIPTVAISPLVLEQRHIVFTAVLSNPDICEPTQSESPRIKKVCHSLRIQTDETANNYSRWRLSNLQNGRDLVPNVTWRP